MLPVVLAAMTLLQACSFGPSVRPEPEPLPQARLDHLESHVFPLDSQDDVLGHLATVPVNAGDTLPDLARHYGVGFQQIADANPGVDPWLPVADDKILLPTQFILPDAPHKGIVVNMATMRKIGRASCRERV